MSSTITNLTAGSTPDGTELMLVVQSGNSRRLTAQEIAETADALALSTLTVSSSITVPDASFTKAKLSNSAALSVLGRASNTSGVLADIAAGTDHQVLRRSGTSIGFGALNLTQTASTTGVLAVAKGGTNAGTAAGARTSLGLAIGTDVQAQNDNLSAIAGLTSAADKVPYFTGTGAAAVADLSSFGRSLIDDANASAARTTLGVAIGTNVQAYDGELAAIAGLTSAADRVPYFTGSETASLATFTSQGRNIVGASDEAAFLALFSTNYHRGNILATVTESSGTPTGGIIERGSNANGSYVRFADGTQICWVSSDFGSILNSGSGTYGDPYTTNFASLTWPAVFSAAPVVSSPVGIVASVVVVAARGIIPAFYTPPSTTALSSVRFMRVTSDSTDVDITANVIATGRWF